VAYHEFENLEAAMPVSGLDGCATRWAETLLVEDAEVLASYEHPDGRRPIVTTKRFGAGRVTYVGTVPDCSLAAALYGESQLWAPSVTALSAVNAAGERLWFVHNWSGASVVMSPPVPVGRIELGPWDVRVLKEAQ